ncbi:MAG: hypothetical protein NUV59_01305 [Patescibacteria group bacterium]|nr:hypothetical protein [Patescibacteria group bacterium]
MKVKITISAIVAILLAGFGVPDPAFACSCVADYSQEQAFEDAEAVFVGRVLSIQEHRNTLRQLFGDDIAPSYRTVKFHVTERWKGIEQNLVTVATGFGGGDCGFYFADGETYLVYAHDGSFYGEELATGICTHTEVLRHAQDDLDALGPGDSLFSQAESIYDPTGRENLLLWILGRPVDTIRAANYTILTGPWHIALGIIALYFLPPVALLYWFVKRRKRIGSMSESE